MSEAKLTSEAMENYLKAIYQLDRGNGASAQEMAAQLDVTGSGVSKMLRHMERLGFVIYAPYRRVRLTETGRKIALEVIRHHRLLELYLMESLGYGWDRVHAEAERLEHHISEEFEERIDQLLGSPAFDPHGDPIPARDGTVPVYATATLESQPDAAWVVVRRVVDEDEALLRYLGEHGIRPGTALRVLGREPFGGPLRLCVAGREERVAPGAARQIFVEPAPNPDAERPDDQGLDAQEKDRHARPA